MEFKQSDSLQRGMTLELSALDTNTEMRPRANHCLWHSSASAPKKVFLQNSLYNKRYSQGTMYHVINQLGPPDRRANRSSMSNQDKKNNHASPYLWSMC